MDKRTNEAIRYLGYGKNAVDVQTLAMISDSFMELETYAEPRHIYRIFALQIQSENCFTIGLNEYSSYNLGKNLKGCDKAIIFAATLGIDVDRLIKKASLSNMAKAVVLQACAAAFLENYCDQCQKEIGAQLSGEGYYLRPRFSPGYGDFSIEYQLRFLEMLQADKHIGLTLTENYMLNPTKSITAIMGLSRTSQPCHIKGCEECDKIDCLYRRS